MKKTLTSRIMYLKGAGCAQVPGLRQLSRSGVIEEFSANAFLPSPSNDGWTPGQSGVDPDSDPSIDTPTSHVPIDGGILDVLATLNGIHAKAQQAIQDYIDSHSVPKASVNRDGPTKKGIADLVDAHRRNRRASERAKSDNVPPYRSSRNDDLRGGVAK